MRKEDIENSRSYEIPNLWIIGIEGEKSQVNGLDQIFNKIIKKKKVPKLKKGIFI